MSQQQRRVRRACNNTITVADVLSFYLTRWRTGRALRRRRAELSRPEVSRPQAHSVRKAARLSSG
jgi:hypothetical protein